MKVPLECLVVLNNLISSPVDHTREVVNHPHLHFNNRADGVEDKVGYIMIKRTSHLVASVASLVFDQVDSRGSKGYAVILNGMHADGCIPRSVGAAGCIGVETHDPTMEHLKLLMRFPPT